MSDTDAQKREHALDFLDELDGRHDHLLVELDQLNAKLDAVLADYSKGRQAAGGPSASIAVVASVSDIELEKSV